jgi:hypothetical protein
MRETRQYKPEGTIVTALKVAVWLAVLGLMVLAIDSPKLLMAPDEPVAQMTKSPAAADGPPPAPASEAPANDMTARTGLRGLYERAFHDAQPAEDRSPTF